jgi:hypothetical protein
MTYFRTVILIGGCLVAAGMALAQEPAAPQLPIRPTAPLAPSPPLPPQPAIAPVAPMAPEAPISPDAAKWDRLQDQAERARAKMDRSLGNLDAKLAGLGGDPLEMDQALAKMDAAMARLQTEVGRIDLPAFAQLGPGFGRGVGAGGRSEDGQYERGQNALDNHLWDQAVDRFTDVAARGGSRADGALYWKAYALNKLGRRDDALAAIAELHKSYANSRWLGDANALEIEVKQASGQKVAPENEPDDDLKLLALNGLVQTDPDRAFPLLENLLKGAQSPKLKKRAIYVLAASNSPRAQQLLEQIARGSGNPDLQLTAISYMFAVHRSEANRGQILAEIYASSNDVNVKRAILNAFASGRDKDRVLQIAKTEKSPELRMAAVGMLSSIGGQAEAWQLYQTETETDVKRRILESLPPAGNTDKLLEVARTEKDANLRRLAIARLASVKATGGSDALVSLYNSEQDPQVKRAVIDGLAAQRNASALVALGRKEQDAEMKRQIVEHLVHLKSPEANDFLMEILK